ncbi:glycoside hydrolase family 43 protein [Metabacillus arenae]|uniref:Glycoside hydrolase family 43 protein n=1 Tax=Metabacillus arenae TaxID=2771434 RepID=A0A926NG52_9BACI|nr:glycoside hydrolase family 43 protein [Metabacillus arenae]MBD1379403.1 glycoside hydrolase family 43 protein [Metabacillus arenae]
METFQNPILPGFYPDPSICRVGEDYYLVTSTFEYFPGVPIFHSKDLVNWRQIGHVLDRPSQLNLDRTPSSRGIYAPTIRYHDGVFYMITTFVVSQTGARKNFYVTATNPSGPWSDPNWLTDAPGIDPSLFFDDDGKVYYTGNRMPPAGQNYPKHMEIWLQELDIETKQLTGPKFSLWDGALKQIHAQEAPHLYKVNDLYYLMIAEGGTGFTHSVTIARSKEITGPYEVCKTNPILTHRHLGRNYPIANVGHADIVETQDGDWWMTCLASRPYGGEFRNLGRETFLVPFTWENGWPVVNPGKGIVEFEGKRPRLKEKRWPSLPVCDHFDSNELSIQWNFIRTPRGDFWSLEERPGFLRLHSKPDSITEETNPSFIGRRQQHIHFAATTVMEFQPENESESAGLVLLQNHNYQFRLVVTKIGENSFVRLVKREAGEEQILASELSNNPRLFFKVEAIGQDYSFYYGVRSEEWIMLKENVDGRILSTDLAGGFVGAYLGMYVSSNGKESHNYADFDWFEYVGIS